MANTEPTVERVPTVDELDAILRGEPCPFCTNENGLDRRSGPLNRFDLFDMHSEGL